MKGAVLAVMATVLAALAFGSASAGEEPSRFVGDANCDRSVSSVDAAVILQFDAALAGIACPANADATWDGVTNSADAGLVLQNTAGLYEGFVRMWLSVTQPEGLCDDADTPTVCNVPAGSEFSLTTSLLNPIPRGYIAFEAYVFYGALDYLPASDKKDEIDWPDAGLIVRTDPEEDGGRRGVIVHGAISAPIRPYPVSNHLGPLSTIRVSCPEEPNAFVVASLPYTSANTLGSGVAFPAQDVLRVVFPAQTAEHRDIDFDLSGTIDDDEENLPLSAVLTINCV